jgi:hypothetical protein
MKNILIRISCFLCLLILTVSCIWHTEDNFSSTSQYEAVIMNRQDFENTVGTFASQDIIKSGKIYIFENLLFISEVNDGFHVFNYQDPTNPVPIKYIKAPGATDLAIRNGILYINQATDLITLKFNEQTLSFDLMHRNKNVFPQKISPDGFDQQTGANEIIVNWTQK